MSKGIGNSSSSSSISQGELNLLSVKLKEIISQLYEIETTVSDYPIDVPNEFIHDKIRRLVSEFGALETLQSSTSVPQDVVEYIEAGRNPNVYTRQFSEAVTRASQDMHGNMAAHQDFARILGDKMGSAFPELIDDIKRAQSHHVEANHKSPTDT